MSLLTSLLPASGGGGGEVNTAANVGAGVGVYETKVGAQLRFNSLVSQSTGLTIAEDDANDEIDFTLDADINAYGALATTGMVVRSGSGTVVTRSITGTADEIDVSNGDGVSGAPTIGLSDNAQLPGTEGLNLPGGTTAQRPGAGVEGDLRKNTDNNTIEYYDGTQWLDLTPGGVGDGDVVGPASATDNAVARFDTTTGKLLQNSSVTVGDTGSVTAGSLTLTTDLAITEGGTGGSTAAAARTNLGVAIGSDVQAYDAALDDISGLAVTNGNIIVGDGANWVAENGATARASLGAGTLDNIVEDTTPQLGGALDAQSNDITSSGDIVFSTTKGIKTGTSNTNTTVLQAYDVDGASYTTFGTLTAGNTPTFDLSTSTTMGSNAIYYATGTDVPITDGGTGASTAGDARTNLGVAIGSDVQAYDAALDDISGLSVANGNIIVGDGANWVAESGATARASLGAGTLDNVVEDTTPQLGGALDAQSNDLTSVGDIVLSTGKAIQTGTTATNTTLLQAYDVDGASYTTFGTLTAGNTPTFDLSTSTTIGGNAFYYAGGTDVPVADGGTGASDAATARTNLGLGSLSTANTINNDNWSGTDLSVANGGTGAGTAAAALSNLGGIGPATSDTLTNKTFDANGTGNSLSNVHVADLANGTDGELITWDAAGAPATVATGTSGHVLTSNGPGTAPTFQAAAGGGLANVVEDTTPQLGGTLDAQSNDITSTGDVVFSTGKALQTGTSNTNTLLLQAYDVDGAAYTTFGTLTAGNTPTFDLSSTTTIGGALAYTVGGTDVPITDGGTGASNAATALSNLGGIGAATTDTLTNKTFDANGTGNSISNIDVADLANGTDGELITWSAAGAPTTVAVGTSGHVLTSNGAGAAPTFQAAAGGGGDTDAIKPWEYKSGNTYCPLWTEGRAGGTFDTAADTIHAIPIELVQDINVDALQIHQTSLTTANTARLIIYNNDTGGDEMPTTVNKDCGTVSVNSTGIKTASFTSHSLTAGRYWLAVHYEATNRIRDCGGNNMSPIHHRETTNFSARSYSGLIFTGQTYSSGAPDLTSVSGTWNDGPTFVAFRIA